MLVIVPCVEPLIITEAPISGSSFSSTILPVTFFLAPTDLLVCWNSKICLFAFISKEIFVPLNNSFNTASSEAFDTFKSFFVSRLGSLSV